ncbi:MAG: pimeloyl-CoA dehydrogenase small subunit [Rhodospirillaceae bacterium]|nr:pimeloyl-CoA dehydrogenase small subunit [Rhodospirillaceae bacterium]
MSFAFTEDQKLLAESVDRFIRDDYTFEARRKFLGMDGGFDRKNWSKFAELGWLALPIDEKYGGLGGSTVDAAVLLESFGRGLVVEPYQSSIVLGAACIEMAGTEKQKTELLPALVEGKILVTVAHTEPKSRFNLSRVDTGAVKGSGNFVLDGRKAIVQNAETADFFIISARTGGSKSDEEGISLFLVGREVEGIELQSYPTIDGFRASEVSFKSVKVDESCLIGQLDRGFHIIENIVDRACVLLCAEAAGVMDRAVDLTVDYIKNREQFGKPIGSFQVLQHRAVDMRGAKDFSRALTFRAAGVIDEADYIERVRAVSAAKVEMGRSGKLIGQESIQLHGGMGMTDDMAIGHYFKRLTMLDVMFGNVDYHRRRFAYVD